MVNMGAVVDAFRARPRAATELQRIARTAEALRAAAENSKALPRVLQLVPLFTPDTVATLSSAASRAGEIAAAARAALEVAREARPPRSGRPPIPEHVFDAVYAAWRIWRASGGTGIPNVTSRSGGARRCNAAARFVLEFLRCLDIELIAEKLRTVLEGEYMHHVLHRRQPNSGQR
jgi:hypothetical protein